MTEFRHRSIAPRSAPKGLKNCPLADSRRLLPFFPASGAKFFAKIPSSRRGIRSAAQNEPVIQVCSHCGAVSNQEVGVCPFCETSFASPETPPRGHRTTSEEPEWRREVARRLEVYRARRHGSEADRAQAALPFGEEGESAGRIATAVAPRTLARLRPAERVEIRVSQPQFDFSVVENFSVHAAASNLPVAELSVRRWAGCLDAAILLGVFIGFLGLFRSMGGQIHFLRVDLAVYAATAFLLYSIYFSLFTAFSGATPGMQARGLCVVALDGNFPETRQLLWRCFGYILSGATLGLGFLWTLWDEDQLTWPDRISRTYLTRVSPSAQETAEHEENSPPLTHHSSAI
jgi:uncharacterized RDD family membrane protein YckC